MSVYNNLPDNFQQIFLSRFAAVTLEGAFTKFIDKEIVIPKGARETASDSHNALRDFLRTEYQNDTTFPVLLKNSDADFIGGSFGRGTKIWPLDDIDIYFPIDGYNLAYTDSGNRLPYRVITDGSIGSNPLLTQRWLEGQNISSKKLVSEFAAVLKRKYPRTEIKPNGQSVSLYTTLVATAESDGICYDVVPCFFLKHDYSAEPEFYLIPDGNNGWIRTNPRLDDQIASDLNNNNNETYKKVVRLLKYWNKEKLGGAFQSYYIELAIAKKYIQENRFGRVFGKISEGVMSAFNALNDAARNGSLTSFVNNAPAVERGGEVTAAHLLHLDAVAKASSYAVSYERSGNSQKAIELWQAVWGSGFAAE